MDNRIAQEVIRLTADRDAFVAEANSRIAVYNTLIARWKALLEPTITQGEEKATPRDQAPTGPVGDSRALDMPDRATSG